jgi:hypothetical protein
VGRCDRAAEPAKPGVEFEYTSAPASVIISAASVSADRDQVFRIPLIDPETVASSTGGYMWRADGTTFTTVYVKNVTNAPQKYLLQLSYEGGAYAPGLKTLQPGETATIDLRALRDAQVPDAWGHTIPVNITSGQVHWSAKGHERYVMIGRAEHTDIAHGVSASYACINCCPDNPYSSWTIDDPIVTSVDDWVDVFLTLQDIDCYNTVLQPYAVDWHSLNWYVADTGIATGSNNATVTGVSAGSTTLYATYEADWWYKDVYDGGWFCNSESYPVSFQTSVQVQAATSLRVVSGSYTTQSFGNYNFQRIYEVLDQNGAVIAKSGQAVTESYSAFSSNGCNLTAPQTASTSTNGQGRFQDNYSMSSAPATCNSNPNCTSAATQTIRVSGRAVGTYTVTWGCNSVTITP